MSDYKTYILNENDLDLWDNYIRNSECGTIFHKIEWLQAAADHSKMRLIPIAVRKGDTTVCLFPLFVKKKYGLRILLSPPNRCAISYLGPVMNIQSRNNYNYEWTYINIIDEIIQFAEKQIGFDYFRIIHVPEMQDMRPYIWKGFAVQPKYTYKFNLFDGNEKIFNNFHTTAKNKTKLAMKNNEISISRDRMQAYTILSLAERRSYDQKIKFRISTDYFNKLMDTSISNNFESTAIIHEGRTIVGSIDLLDKNNVYAWIASMSKEDYVPGGGELSLWERIKDYHNRGYKTFDMVDANIRRLCKHKSRYGASLVNYYYTYKTSIKGNIALKLINMYNNKINDSSGL